jgi:cation/acetate symporter
MGTLAWTWIFVAVTFVISAAVALRTRARTARAYYVADQRISPVVNGMATAADWISAASFLSMASLVAFLGRDGSMYLVGWTGGYVLLAVLLAPYLRKYGKYTVPQFVGDRYDSHAARTVALVCAIVVSFTYVAGQLRGVGIVLARFLDTSILAGVVIGMIVVFLYTAVGGLRGITYTQAAQAVVLLVAFVVPAALVSQKLTGWAIPSIGLGAALSDEGAHALGSVPGRYLLDALDGIDRELGFAPYTTGQRPRLDVLFVTLALMTGTAGLPHILIRFFTVPKIRDARATAGWALLFIAVLYLTAPAVAAFGRLQTLSSLDGAHHADAPAWFERWERTGLVSFTDRDGDGRMRISGDHAVNEVAIDRDVLVLASAEIAALPPWAVGLLAAGALVAALSSAAGLLLVIGAAISHDLVKSMLLPRLSERGELWLARLAAAVAVVIAGRLGAHPAAPVAQTVALAFGFAASSFFPVLVAGIFWKRATRQGAIAGMLSGLIFTAGYVTWFVVIRPDASGPAHWWLGISPEGIGTVGLLVNVAMLVVVSLATRPPSQQVQELVANLRYPRDAEPEPEPARGRGRSSSGPLAW